MSVRMLVEWVSGWSWNPQRAAIKHPGDRSLAQALKLAELDRDAFFYRFKSVSELLEAVA